MVNITQKNNYKNFFAGSSSGSGKAGTSYGRLLLFLLLFLLSLLSAGCGSKTAAEETLESTEKAAEITEASSRPEETAKAIEAFSEQDEETTEAPTEETEPAEDETPPQEGMVRSPLTNEWTTKELAEKRPIAVMYPMDKKAQPQYGLDRIQILYEIMEEGGMSRQMALLTEWEDLERIGNIRSTRDYYIISSMEWDAILVHYGGPEVFVKDLLTREDVDNVNGVGGVMGSDYGAFFRVPAGSKSEHTAYTSGQQLQKAIEKAGFETGHREAWWQPKRWKFASASHPVDLEGEANVTEATEIDMAGCYPITKSSFTYHPEDGLYYRSIYGSPQKDAVTGQQLAFTNILIESCTWGERGAGYLYFHVLDEGHKGWYITGGKMIPCTWSKTEEYGVTRFYDLNGQEITLNTGKTMICIGRDCDSFTVNGTKVEL